MRIVHLVIGGEVAGGQIVARQIARAARQRGHESVFVSPTSGPFLDEIAAESFGVRFVDLRRTYHLVEALRFARLLRRLRADVLHTHTQIAPNVLGRVAGRFAGAAVVSHMHIENYFRPSRLAAAYHARVDNATARLCARIVVVSEQTRRALERQGYPSEKMEVVHNGIELAENGHAGLRRELGVGPETPIVAEVARLAPVKGQRELLEAFARLDGDARLVLVGEDLEGGGSYRQRLEREAERLGIRGRVLFTGYRPDAADLLQEIDLVALPSWSEGLPIVLLEAMARRKAVVATPVGGTGELVADGETGVLVPAGDVDALANALRSLLFDPERRRRLGEAGYRRVAESFSVQRMTSRILEIYEEVAACRS